MSEEADPILMFFTEEESENPDTLYTALGVKRDSPVDEIRKAYRKAALRCHPDKHAGKSKVEVARLSTEFQKIGFAWAVLSDEKRRKRYDATGRTDELKFADAEEAGWDAYFEELFERVDRKLLDEDKLKYQGSEEELADLREAYESSKGNFQTIVESIPHGGVEDEARYVTAIEAEIKAGTLKRTKKWNTTSTDTAAATKRKRRAEKESQAAEDAAKELGVWDEFYGSGKKGRRAADGKENRKGKADGGEDALAALIVRRQKERAGNALDAIADKYAALDKKKSKKGKGKNAAAAEAEPHPDELDDDAFAALQAKMFGGGSNSGESSKKKKRKTK